MDWRVVDLTQKPLVGASHMDGINGTYMLLVESTGLCDYFIVGSICEESYLKFAA